MNRVTKEEKTSVKITVLSILAQRQEDLAEDEEQVNIVTHHIPSLVLNVTSLEKAEELGLEKAQELWPKEEGWSHDVVAEEFEIPLTAKVTASVSR